MISPKLRHALNQYAARGGKVHRRRVIRRIEQIVQECGCPAEQIGRRHIHELYERKPMAPTTQRDYDEAVRVLWARLGRPGTPPRAPVTRSDRTDNAAAAERTV